MEESPDCSDEAVAREREGEAVVVVALDGLDLLDEAHGPGAVAELVEAVERRLRACSRRGDRIMRVDADHFVMVFSDVSDVEMLRAIATRIHAMLRTDLTAAMTAATVAVAVSVGAALSCLIGETDDVIVRADAAMQVARQNELGRALLSGDEAMAVIG